MTLDHFRPHVKDWFNPFIAVAMKMGLTPNILTVGSLVAAIAAGIFFYFNYIAAAVVMVALNAGLDALDGALARAMNLQSPKGDFLDHVVDRYADIFIITGIIGGGSAGWLLGIFALTGVLMSSYLGTQAQAVGVGRFYGGVLGRADRLLLIMVAGILTLVFPEGVLGLPLLGWLLVIFGVFGHFTAVQRFAHTWRKIE